MSEYQFAGIGAYLFGALYLASVLAAGIAQGNSYAVLWSIAAMGAAYLSQVVTAFQIAGVVGSSVGLLSWLAAGIIAAIAGLTLLIGA